MLTTMRVLVACEFSGVVRDAFNRIEAVEAMSCDLLPTTTPGPHYQGDVRDVLGYGWDLMVCHPPCRFIAVSGARWMASRPEKVEAALAFVRLLLDAPIPRIALENPVSIISTRIRKPDQYVQPWMFGHGETKKTGLWLKNLPLLLPTDVVDGREQRVWKLPPSADRWKLRSTTYAGLAAAMAAQWAPRRILATDQLLPRRSPASPPAFSTPPESVLDCGGSLEPR